MQAANAPPSREHSNAEPASEELNTKLALVEFIGLDGALVMVVPGGVISMLQSNVAGVASVLPAISVARTLNA